MPEPRRISFVTLGARDLQRLREFYTAWGWHERAGGTDDFAQFDAGGVRLALFPLDRLRDEAAPGAELPPAGGWNGITLAINLSDLESVDEVHRAAVEAGAEPVADPVDREWGGHSGYIADPEGNRWEIAWAPGFPL